MRLLWICHFPVFGGPHNLALRLAKPLSSVGIEVIALIPTDPGNAAERLRGGGVETVQLPLHRLRATLDPRPAARLAVALVGDAARVRRLMRQRRIDVAVVGGLASPHTALAVRRAGAALVWQILDSRSPAVLRRAVMPLVRRSADSVMFNGRTLIDLHTQGRPLAQETFVFTGAVDTEQFKCSPDRRVEARRRFGVPEDALLVGTIANLNPMKGIEYFIRAAARIHRVREDAWFLISGASYETHARYRGQLETEMEASGVPRQRFIVVDDPPDDHYRALDVKLITSLPRSEGTTTTALEAMACGVPVVATRVGAVGEVVDEGVTGLLVAPRDPQAIAEATLRLASDPSLRQRLGQAGRTRVVERYGLQATVDLHVRAIEAARAHAAGRGTPRRLRRVAG